MIIYVLPLELFHMFCVYYCRFVSRNPTFNTIVLVPKKILHYWWAGNEPQVLYKMYVCTKYEPGTWTRVIWVTETKALKRVERIE